MAKDKKPIFIGTFSSSIDSKNRVAIPAKWKTHFTEELYIKKGYEGCLEIRTADEFEVYAESFINASSEEQNNRIIKRLSLGSAQSLHIDSWGRFVIPNNWIKASGITKDIYLIGIGNVVEIWDAELYDAYLNEHAGKSDTLKVIKGDAQGQ